MNPTLVKNSNWIKTPAADLFYFSFGWLLVLLAYFCVDQSGFKDFGRTWLLNFVLLIAVFHRHLTFPLVYADPDQFRQRPRSYIWYPALFLALTVAGYLYIRPPTLTTDPIPTPVAVSPQDRLRFRVHRGSKTENLSVRFLGTEKTVQDLAATIEGSLGRQFDVSTRGDRLQFVLKDADSNSSFRVFRELGTPDLLPRLGLGHKIVKGLKAAQPLLIGLITLSILWNFYHTLTQKIGILRVYSRKAAYGKAWLDKAMVWSWFIYLFFQLGAMPSVFRQISGFTLSGRYLAEAVAPALKVFPYFALLSLAVATVITALYVKEEWSNRQGFHWPKNIFMASILILYGLFFYDFLVAYVVFGFSHALEYVAFVAIFSRKKFMAKGATSSWMARWVRRPGLSMGIFMGASSAVFIPWYFLAGQSLTAYILGSGFLHFLYDGWIWKVRSPEVGKPLGIDYALPPKLQVA